MITLYDIYELMVYDSEQGWVEEFLYDLLAERPADANISHSKMPTMAAHCAFIRSSPYLDWYIIEDYEAGKSVGACYITRQREVGIGILKEYQGHSFGSEAIKMLMIKHPGKLLANISPRNPGSVKFFKQFNARLIQQTYEIS